MGILGSSRLTSQTIAKMIDLCNFVQFFLATKDHYDTHHLVSVWTQYLFSTKNTA